MIKFLGSTLLMAGVVLIAGLASAQECANTDFNGDGATDAADLEIFRSALGSAEGDDRYFAAADLDGDGGITPADYSLILACN